MLMVEQGKCTPSPIVRVVDCTVSHVPGICIDPCSTMTTFKGRYHHYSLFIDENTGTVGVPSPLRLSL